LLCCLLEFERKTNYIYIIKGRLRGENVSVFSVTRIDEREIHNQNVISMNLKNNRGKQE
jgi:hypothetical protein